MFFNKKKQQQKEAEELQQLLEKSEKEFNKMLIEEFKVTKKQVDETWKEIGHVVIDCDRIIDIVKVLFKDKTKEEQLKIYLYYQKMTQLLDDED